MAEQQFSDLMVAAKNLVAQGEKCLKDAAEHIAKASEQGASQRQIAEEIGKSQAWVCRLLAWRSAGYADETPFGPESKAKRERAAHDQATDQAEANQGDDQEESDQDDTAFERARRARQEKASGRSRQSSKRELLIKTLGMLGSEHAGERDSAALLAERLRKEIGMRWEDLIVDVIDDIAEAA